MQRSFLYFYILILALVGCDINHLWDAWYYDACSLLVFLSVSFMMLNFVKVYENKVEKNFFGKSELFLYLFLFWSAASFYFSVHPELTSFPALKSLGAIAFGLGLFLYLDNKDQLAQAWLVSYIFAGIHASLGIMERFFPLFISGGLGPVQGSESLFTNQNFYSCYLLIHIPVGLYLHFIASRAFSKNLIGLGWIFILVALGLSDSQAALIIGEIQIIIGIIYFLVRKEPERAKLVGLAAAVAFLIYYNLVQLIPGGSILSLKTTSVTEPEGTWMLKHVGLRLRYWEGAWKIFCEHWLLGSGLWTFSELYPYTGLLETYTGSKFFHNPPHAHSVYFQTAAESGLIGFVLLTCCLIYLFRGNIKQLVENKQKPLELNFFLLVSMAGFLLHNISESNWFNSLFIYYFVFLIVSIEHLRRLSSNQPLKPVYLKKGLLLPSLLIVALLVGYALVNFYKYNEIILSPISPDHNLIEYERGLSRAKNICERCAGARYLSGLAKIDRYQMTKNKEFMNEAQKEFSEALVRNPYNAKIHLIQGDIFSFLGKMKVARNSYKMAMKHPWYTLSAVDKIKNLRNLKESVGP